MRSPAAGTSGVQTSTPLGQASSAFTTPTTVTARRSRVMVRPTTPGSAAKRRSQTAVESIATGAAAPRTSSGENVRPATGRTPSASKKPPVTNALCSLSGSPAPDRLATP
ncbi:MAG TPA: hypothetical protein VEQ10_16620, partial [Vicinamibacteria bacterium]|nr:hypothetical protein [Vicinamibacteria bacterium]